MFRSIRSYTTPHISRLATCFGLLKATFGLPVLRTTQYNFRDCMWETKQLRWYGHVKKVEEGRLSKGVMKWSPPGRRKRGRPELTWAEGIRGLMRGKGINGRRLELQRKLEEEDNVIVKWAQEDVGTLYSLLNKYM